MLVPLPMNVAVLVLAEATTVVAVPSPSMEVLSKLQEEIHLQVSVVAAEVTPEQLLLMMVIFMQTAAMRDLELVGPGD